MDPIGSLLERPKQYYNIDGVGEVGIGFFLLSTTLLQWLQVHTPKDAVWHQMYVCAIYFAIVLSIVHHGSKAIKRHITYPRTGFVEYRARGPVGHSVIMGSAAVVGALVSAGLFIGIRRHWDFTPPAAFLGLLFAASYARGFARAARWKWIVVWAMALGSLMIAVLPSDFFEAFASPSWMGAWLLSMTLYGAMLSISGGVTFWLYLRHTESPAQELP